MGHNRTNIASTRSMTSNAPKSEKCMNCLPLWDRKGNVKAIQLCGYHQLVPELVKALGGLLIAISPDYDIEAQEHYFHEPMRRALAVIKKAEGK